jgi:hypothetical protein
MKNKYNEHGKIDTVFVLLIFCVFAVSMLVVLMLGGSIYKNMTDISKDGYNERTTLSYIWSKAKNLDNEGHISVSYFSDSSALSFQEIFGDTTYETLIYLHDGWVRELFYETGFEFYPEHGTPIIETNLLYFEEISNGLIRATTEYGSLLISPRSTSSTEQLMRGGF